MSESEKDYFYERLEKIVNSIFFYQQRQNRWKMARFALIAFFIISSSTGLLSRWHVPSRVKVLQQKHVALIDLKGEIHASFDTAIPSTAANIIPSLSQAFSNPNVVGVILRINSLGGSAVQSHQLFEYIRFLRTKYPKVTIYAFCQDCCVSGGYYIASACHEIYASPHSMVGAIGVIQSGFGYHNALKKDGIDRWVVTAGDKKSMLDPYLPIKETDIEILQEMQNEMHRVFIADVKKGRGNRLNVADNAKDLFSGRLWTGTQAMRLGLIDQVGVETDILNKFEEGVLLVNYNARVNNLLYLKKMFVSTLPDGMRRDAVSIG